MPSTPGINQSRLALLGDCISSLSNFDLTGASPSKILEAKWLVEAFHEVERFMESDKAVELASFLPRAWEDAPQNWKDARLLYAFRKVMPLQISALYYPFRLSMAIWWGLGHDAVEVLTNGMEILWGVEFLTDRISYPEGPSLETSFLCFKGRHTNLILEKFSD
ncbi:hypothetical protein NW762_010525 [Fusarium torreyae]|uniref:Uncharacterized protein n=1 Tax=Fusarium torreyae TaxID=1237075 RepID=A0A9W8RRE7_9HYPO|nr:hypothetical protein NW762_010525 [Fusarium torreyae]